MVHGYNAGTIKMCNHYFFILSCITTIKVPLCHLNSGLSELTFTFCSLFSSVRTA